MFDTIAISFPTIWLCYLSQKCSNFGCLICDQVGISKNVANINMININYLGIVEKRTLPPYKSSLSM